MSVLAPLVGALADKYSARRLVNAGLIDISLFCIGISRTRAVWQFMALYVRISTLLGVVIDDDSSQCAGVALVRQTSRMVLGLTTARLDVSGVAMPLLVAAVMPELG